MSILHRSRLNSPSAASRCIPSPVMSCLTFNGSGTTCVAAKMHGRRYLGVDLSELCAIAEERLRQTEALDFDALSSQSSAMLSQRLHQWRRPPRPRQVRCRVRFCTFSSTAS